jgi:hypothetical protein
VATIVGGLKMSEEKKWWIKAKKEKEAKEINMLSNLKHGSLYKIIYFSVNQNKEFVGIWNKNTYRFEYGFRYVSIKLCDKFEEILEAK